MNETPERDPRWSGVRAHIGWVPNVMVPDDLAYMVEIEILYKDLLFGHRALVDRVAYEDFPDPQEMIRLILDDMVEKLDARLDEIDRKDARA